MLAEGQGLCGSGYAVEEESSEEDDDNVYHAHSIPSNQVRRAAILTDRSWKGETRKSL